MSRPRAAILLTGNELLRGVISDANAPHLARALERLGFSLTRTVIVGDDLDDIRAGLRTALETADLVVTSGGLGPTHDDRTVEAIAAEAGVPLVLDEDVLGRITRWTNGVAERYGFEPGRFDAGNRKQAHIPEGADVLGIAGTAPALVVRMGDARLVVLPGVPSELRRLWPLAPDHPALAELFARAQPRRRWLIRTYGIGESHVADLFAEAGGDPEGVETSICARNFEIEIDIRAEDGSEANGAAMNERMTAALGEFVFADDERPLSEIVLDVLGGQNWTAATAESCTGGMVAASLTDIAGSSSATNRRARGLPRRSRAIAKRVLPGASAAAAAGAAPRSWSGRAPPPASRGCRSRVPRVRPPRFAARRRRSTRARPACPASRRPARRSP